MSVGSVVHMLQLVVKVFETATAYCRRVNSALAIVKKVKSCGATERLIQLAGKKAVKMPNPMAFVISSHMSIA